MSHGHGHHHDDTHAKQQAWQDAWAHAFFNDPESWLAAADKEALRRSFGNHGGVLMCIDEGVEPDDHDSVYLAGSGILYQKHQHKAADDRRAKLVEHLKHKGITGVTSHAGCGACALHCAECGEGEPEETAQQWSRQLADDLGVPYVEHVTDLRRPHFHNALAAYYDGTGRFMDPARSGLPPGFIISRELVPDADHAAYELDLASQIAMGGHGFGDMFTAEKPFHFVVVVDPAHPELTEDVLVAEVRPIVERRPQTKLVVLRMPS